MIITGSVFIRKELEKKEDLRQLKQTTEEKNNLKASELASEITITSPSPTIKNINSNTSLEKYKNNKYGLSFSHPKSWEVKKTGKSGVYIDKDFV